jgi:hypothetical protein
VTVASGRAGRGRVTDVSMPQRRRAQVRLHWGGPYSAGKPHSRPNAAKGFRCVVLYAYKNDFDMREVSHHGGDSSRRAAPQNGRDTPLRARNSDDGDEADPPPDGPVLQFPRQPPSPCRVVSLPPRRLREWLQEGFPSPLRPEVFSGLGFGCAWPTDSRTRKDECGIQYLQI